MSIQRVYRTSCQDVTDMTMPFTSGVDVSVPAYEPQEDIFVYSL